MRFVTDLQRTQLSPQVLLIFNLPKDKFSDAGLHSEDQLHILREKWKGGEWVEMIDKTTNTLMEENEEDRLLAILERLVEERKRLYYDELARLEGYSAEERESERNRILIALERLVEEGRQSYYYDELTRSEKCPVCEEECIMHFNFHYDIGSAGSYSDIDIEPEWEKITLCGCDDYMRDADEFLCRKGLLEEFDRSRNGKKVKREYQDSSEFKAVLRILKFLKLFLNPVVVRSIARGLRLL